VKRKHYKIDIDDFNDKIVKKKLKSPLYVLNELDLQFLNPQYRSKKRSKKK